MILHGIEAPNIQSHQHAAENLAGRRPGEGPLDIVLANPPVRRQGAQGSAANFLIRTGETAFLFLQHFIKGGEARAVAPPSSSRTPSSNTDNAFGQPEQTTARKAATRTPCSIAPAARSSARGQNRGAVFSRKAHEDAKGLVPTSSIRVATSGRPTRSTTLTRRIHRLQRPLPIRRKLDRDARILTTPRST